MRRRLRLCGLYPHVVGCAHLAGNGGSCVKHEGHRGFCTDKHGDSYVGRRVTK